VTEEKEFRSKVEDLVDRVKELRFPSSAGFKPFTFFFNSSSVAHPAKMNLYLLGYLIEKYTRKGDVVADIMAGTGSTGIIASYLGRHSVLVELEEKFVKWIKENVKLLEQHGGKKGEIKVLKGDARKLTELLGLNADDAVITSPPYSTAQKGGGIAIKGHFNDPKLADRSYQPKTHGESSENIGNLSHGEISTIVTSPPYSESLSTIDDEERRLERTKGKHPNCGYLRGKRRRTASHSMGDGYSENPENIGNLPHGEIDIIVTSPPYVETLAKENPKRKKGYWKTSGGYQTGHGTEDYGENPENIGNLPLEEVDAVITSPPYSNILSGDKDGPSATSIKNPSGFKPSSQPGYTQEKTWTEKHKIDAVITSPPYEGALEGTTRHTKGGIASRDPALAQSGTYATTLSKATKQGVPIGYSPNKDNIGNLKSEEKEYKELEEKVNVVITSPPYSDSYKTSSKTREEQAKRVPKNILKKRRDGGGPLSLFTSPKNVAAKEFLEGMPKSKDNIGNLQHGDINIVITSPPYAEANRGGGIAVKGYEGKYGKDEKLHLRHDRPSSDNPDNISNKPYREDVEATPELVQKLQKLKDEKKGRSETYLEAMLLCYRECYNVLKPNGRIIVVIKPFIRNKKVVDLPYHTWLLLQKCGFKLSEVLKFRLPQISFWRVLYRQKHPEVERINHEYILVCKK